MMPRRYHLRVELPGAILDTHPSLDRAPQTTIDAVATRIGELGPAVHTVERAHNRDVLIVEVDTDLGDVFQAWLAFLMPIAMGYATARVA